MGVANVNQICRVYFRILAKGEKRDVMVYQGGAKQYDPLGSEHTFDKL